MCQFLTLIRRKPILPIEMEFMQSDDSNNNSDGNGRDSIDKYCGEMMKLKKDLFSKADKKIKNSQASYKRYYDNKHHKRKVCWLISLFYIIILIVVYIGTKARDTGTAS